MKKQVVSRVMCISLLAGCMAFAVQPPSAQAGPSRPAATVLAPRSSIDAADTWCYVYSTAIGLYWAPAGAAAGALCLFVKDRKTPTAYTCYARAPVNHGYGFVAAYGAKSVNRRGRCAKGEWGYHRIKHSWARFTK